MRKISPILSSLALTITAVIAIGTPVQALEYGNPAPETQQSKAVAALKIGKTGRFGDCTGTLIDVQWILTARHCLEATKNQGSQARFGQGNNTEIYNVDSWALSPTADIGLMHLDRKISNITPATLSSVLPKAGEIGRIYGWSSSSSMARKNILPTGKWEVKGDLGLSQLKAAEPDVEISQPDTHSSQYPNEIQVSGAPQLDKIPDDTVTTQPPGINDSLPDRPESDVVPMIGGLLELQSINEAAIQGGDSGGPFFINEVLAGVLTAGTGQIDANTPSRGIVLTPVASSLQWIHQIINGQNKDSIVTPETARDPLPMQQVSQPYAKKTLIGSILIIFIAGVIVRLKKK